jgi:hypothetical protein
LFAGKRLLAVGSEPALRCWRGQCLGGDGRAGIEAQMMRRGGAHGINASHNRTDRAIDNRIRRDVGGGIDDDTHRNPPQALARKKQKGMKQYFEQANGQTRRPTCHKGPQRRHFLCNCRLSAAVLAFHQCSSLNTTSTKGAGQRLYSLRGRLLNEVASKSASRVERFARIRKNFGGSSKS